MKNVLFTTTAIAALAIAGTAKAGGHLDLGWSGTAEFGYYVGVDGAGEVADLDSGDLGAEAGVNVKATSTLDNGVKATLSYGFDLDAAGGSFTFDGDEDVEIGLEGSNFMILYGGENYAGDAVDFDNDNGNTLYLETSFNDITLSMSRQLDDNGTDETSDLEIGVEGAFGDFAWGLGYSDRGTSGADEVFGVSLDFDAGMFSVGLDADTEENWDVTLGYDAGIADLSVNFDSNDVIDVTAKGEAGDLDWHVAIEDVTEEAGDMNPIVRLGYEMNPVTLYLGFSDVEGVVAAMEYDLGGDAAVVISYGEDKDLDGETDDDAYDEGFQAIIKMAF